MAAHLFIVIWIGQFIAISLKNNIYKKIGSLENFYFFHRPIKFILIYSDYFHSNKGIFIV